MLVAFSAPCSEEEKPTNRRTAGTTAQILVLIKVVCDKKYTHTNSASSGGVRITVLAGFRYESHPEEVSEIRRLGHFAAAQLTGPRYVWTT